MFIKMYLASCAQQPSFTSHRPCTYYCPHHNQFVHRYPRIRFQHFPRQHLSWSKSRTCGSRWISTYYIIYIRVLKSISTSCYSLTHIYATNVELVAATQLYGVDFRITYHTEPQQYPNPPPPKSVISYYIIHILSTTNPSDIHLLHTYFIIIS